MSKRRRNPSFPTHENYGAQDPSDPALASQRAVDQWIRNYILKAMKRYKPLLSLDKAGIIKEARYTERQAVGQGARPGNLNRFITFTTGRANDPRLVLSIQWSGYEMLTFDTKDINWSFPPVSAPGDEPEDVKLVCDLMRYTVTGKTSKLEATIDELVSRGRM